MLIAGFSVDVEAYHSKQGGTTSWDVTLDHATSVLQIKWAMAQFYFFNY